MQLFKKKCGASLCGLAAVFLAFTTSVDAQSNFGQFEGSLVVEAVGSDGRELKLVKPFSFVDPQNVRWQVPTGTVVDGASIPKAFWSVIGGPFSGRYRNASVIHDHYSETRDRPWQEVHRTFFNGMRANGVSAVKARIMYAAVYRFGPRWILATDAQGQKVQIAGAPDFDQVVQDRLNDFLEEKERTPEEIAAHADELTHDRSINAVINQRLAENCGPVLPTNAQDQNVFVLCGLNTDAKRLNATRNLSVLISDLTRLSQTQSTFLAPAIERYAKNPTPENRAEATQFVAQVSNLVRVAARSALDYDSTLSGDVGTTTDELFRVLRQRGRRLAQWEEIPAEPVAINAWLQDYRQIMTQLNVELSRLKQKLVGS